MVHDKKLICVCGETSSANAKQSLITTMQIYEYFISHHMAKAFESLFGSVTCLLGCFTLYRLRALRKFKVGRWWLQWCRSHAPRPVPHVDVLLSLVPLI
jgi:cellulose synthase/poly-beta-1,6-N-acetylglucosamine synthase-like glycosyltransferase